MPILYIKAAALADQGGHPRQPEFFNPSDAPRSSTKLFTSPFLYSHWISYV
jgi:hypothetical protein